MLAFAFYLLKVIICSAVLFGYYWFFLRNKIFHHYNRFLLLAIVAISLSLPLMKINIWHKAEEPRTTVIKMLQVVNSSDEYLDEIVIYSRYNHVSKEQVFSLLYVIISLVFLFMMIQVLLKIRNLLKNNSSTFIENIYFIKTNARGTPFSFLKFIFWNDAIDIETKAGKQIFKHEIAHVQEKHSYDKLFINAILIFFWCNPFFWLIRKELNMIHEFIADKKAVEDGDTADFAAMILQATYPQYRFPLTNNFFYSPIKRRLQMLTKQHKTKVSYISRLLVLPLAVIVFAAFSIKARTYTNKLINKPLTVVIDAGHGGTDKGATALDGSFEKDMTLALALKIKELNTSENINIILTRSTDILQTPKEKAEYAKAAGADLLISVHISSAPDKAKNIRSGLEVFVAKDNFSHITASKLLASSVIAVFRDNYALPVLANPQQREQNISVLQESKCPAVLIEAGYLSNEKDLAYLKMDKAVETFARNVLNAIENYSANKTALKDHTVVSDTTTGMHANVKNTDADYLKSDMFKSKALLIVDSKEIGNLGFDYAEKNFSISSITVYDPSRAIKIYGKKGKYGVAEILSKKDAVPDYKAIIDRIENDVYADASQIVNVPGSGRVIMESVLSGNYRYEPLFIVNGKQATKTDVNKIIPSMITDMRVLKSSTATPTYGFKGKHGVIIINTKAETIPKNALTVIDNKIYEGRQWSEIIHPDDIDTITFLEKDKAVKKYGIRANDGVIEVTTKKTNQPKPIFTLSGITDNEINISQIKNLKEVTFNIPGYSFKSADLYFSGNGFSDGSPQYEHVYLKQASLQDLDGYFKRLKGGSVLTFDNVIAQTKDGSTVAVDGRSIRFHDEHVLITKKTNRQEPIITLSGIAGPRIHIGQLDYIKDVKCDLPGYSFISATVYFSGGGFPQVISAQLKSGSLENLKAFFNKVIAGSAVTFDDIMVQKKDGTKMTIAGRSFSFYDAKSAPVLEPQKDNTLFIGAENVIVPLLEGTGYSINDLTATISRGSIYKKADRYLATVSPGNDVEVSFFANNKLIAKNIFQVKKLELDADRRSYIPHHFITIERDPNEKVFVKTEISPDFPGGPEAWQAYLRKNINPGTPVDEGWKAGSYRIIVQFIVDQDGNVSDVKTNNYPKSKTAKQCIDLIKNGPKWLPAKQNGRNVKAYKKQPISFVVSEG